MNGADIFRGMVSASNTWQSGGSLGRLSHTRVGRATEMSPPSRVVAILPPHRDLVFLAVCEFSEMSDYSAVVACEPP